MKGNKKLLIVAVLLLLIAVSYGTYAIYRESTTATGTINAAAWSVKLNTNDFSSSTLTFGLSDLTCGTSNPGKNGTIAPGAECYIDYAIDADGSEVDVVIDAEIDTEHSSNIPTNMTVSVSDTLGTASPLTIPYSATEGEMEKTARLNIVWPGALTDTSTKDTQDLSSKDAQITIVVKLTARQALGQ